MAAPPGPVCSAIAAGVAAITVAAAPVFSILRLIGSIIGVLLTSGRLTLRMVLGQCEISRVSSEPIKPASETRNRTLTMTKYEPWDSETRPAEPASDGFVFQASKFPSHVAAQR